MNVNSFSSHRETAMKENFAQFNNEIIIRNICLNLSSQGDPIALLDNVRSIWVCINAYLIHLCHSIALVAQFQSGLQEL